MPAGAWWSCRRTGESCWSACSGRGGPNTPRWRAGWGRDGLKVSCQLPSQHA